jgi:hypothetical protein
VVYQINLEMAWLLLVPGDATHGDVTGQSVGVFGTVAWQARLVLPDPSQNAPDGRDADLLQLLEQFG